MKNSFKTTALKRNMLIVFLLCFSMHGTAQPKSADLPQFLFPEFSKAVLRMRSGEFASALMNYNTVTRQMTFYQNSDIMVLTKPENVDTILLQNKLFVYINHEFYEVAVNKPITLFIQHKSDLLSTGRPAGYGTTSQTSGPSSITTLYSDNKAYNLKLPENYKVRPSPVNWIRVNNVLHKIQSLRQFVKIFPGNEKELTSFINKSKTDINKPGDMINLVIFCNDLNR